MVKTYRQLYLLPCNGKIFQNRELSAVFLYYFLLPHRRRKGGAGEAKNSLN
jgi:hypothetical protein